MRKGGNGRGSNGQLNKTIRTKNKQKTKQKNKKKKKKKKNFFFFKKKKKIQGYTNPFFPEFGF